MIKEKKIDSFFLKKENIVSDTLIETLIREQFGKVLNEAKSGKASNTPSMLPADLESIPNVEIAELPWADVRMEGNKEISSDERSSLMKYLKNIKGSSLKEKTNSINGLYKMQTLEDLERYGIIQPESPIGRKIGDTISYLVFLKTLTKMITNFNASVTGFLFEAFLGVMLNGKQIPVSAKTLADLIGEEGGEKIYFSTKLLTVRKETDTTSAGGSFAYLGNDLLEKNFIRYIIATKHFKGEGKSTEGVINIFKLDVNLDNIFDILYNSSVGTRSSARNHIRLPKLFIAHDAKEDYEILKPKPAPKKVTVKTKKQNKQAQTQQGVSPLAEQEDIQPDDDQESDDKEKFSDVEKIIYEDFASPEESLKFYNSLTDKTAKARCINNCIGALEKKPFSIRKEVLSDKYVEPYGSLIIGVNSLQTVLDKFVGTIQAEILDINRNISLLNRNFSDYIAGGLEDHGKAILSQKFARGIDKKTGDVVSAISSKK